MNSNPRAIFHLSLHITSLQESRDFYGGVLNCLEGRSTERWVDFDFFGHQLSLHLGQPTVSTLTGSVEQIKVPMPHFGVVLDPQTWESCLLRLRAAGTAFILDPLERYPDKAGAQRTLFVEDPSHNAIELKCLHSESELFSSDLEVGMSNV